jgi:hypothetical protein
MGNLPMGSSGGDDRKTARNDEQTILDFSGIGSSCLGMKETGTDSNGCGRCFSSSCWRRPSSGGVTTMMRSTYRTRLSRSQSLSSLDMRRHNGAAVKGVKTRVWSFVLTKNRLRQLKL